MGGSGLLLVRVLPIKVISQGASSSGKPVVEQDLNLIASKLGRLHPEKTKLSGNVRMKLQMSGVSQGSTGDNTATGEHGNTQAWGSPDQDV